MDTRKTKSTADCASGRIEMPGSMSRSVYCDSCTQRFLKTDREGTCCRCLRGRAIWEFYCDFCNKRLSRDSECFAFSVYERPGNYLPWEEEYLLVPQVVLIDEPGKHIEVRATDDVASAPDPTAAPPIWKREHGHRCRLQGHSSTVTVIVGWDRPVNTYFAQVWDTTPRGGYYGHGELLLWLGTAFNEVVTVAELSEALKAHATVPADLQQLLHDFRSNPAGVDEGGCN